MTTEDEKQLIVLAAILLVGGNGSKQDVLDAVEDSSLMRFSTSDLKIRESRNELVWRNDLAFIRSHLVKDGCISSKWDSWAITDKGRARAASLLSKVGPQSQLQHINRDSLSIIQATASPKPTLSDESATARERELVEGAKIQRWTTAYERNPALRAAAIQIHGLACMACKFDFGSRYGAHGEGFAEVHHLNPISEAGTGAVDAQADLVVLCSNCHSMIHRRRPKPLTLAELVAILQ